MEQQEPPGEEAGTEGRPATGRKGLARGVYLLPNLITTGALFAGFYAIISAMGNAFYHACVAIVVAGFLDALDGRVARLTNTQSKFGVQYDSLSDLVAFGVAPAILLFSWALEDMGKVGWAVAFLYMACAALRLARFNMAPESAFFQGLPSPAAAVIMATMVWTWTDNLPTTGSTGFSVTVALIATVTGLLMVSGIRYYSPKHTKGRVPFTYMLGVVFLFVVVAAYPAGVLFILGAIYAFSGPVQAIIRRRNRKVTSRDGA